MQESTILNMFWKPDETGMKYLVGPYQPRLASLNSINVPQKDLVIWQKHLTTEEDDVCFKEIKTD